MNRNLLTRLMRLENRYRPEPIIVLAEYEDGRTVEMPARKCIDQGLGFVRVVRGNNMLDLDALLNYIYDGIYDGRDSY